MQTRLTSQLETSSPGGQPQGVEELIEQACTFFGEKNLGSARDALSEALRQSPGRVDLMLFKGNVLYHMRDLHAARTQFQEAAGVDPSQALVRLSLAAVEQELGQLTAAEACVRDALALDPSLLEGRKLLGGILLRNGRFAEANETFAEILARDPLNLDAHLSRGLCCYELKDVAGATRAYQQALTLDPGNALAKENLALLLKRAQPVPAAITEADPREVLSAVQRLFVAETQLKAQDKTEVLEQLQRLSKLLGQSGASPSPEQVRTLLEAIEGTLTVLPDPPSACQARNLVTRLVQALIPPAVQSQTIPIPPPSLRFHIDSAWTTLEKFLETSTRSKEHILASVSQAGRRWEDLRSVLDFGCGCGRTLRAFAQEGSEKEFYGSDIDAEAIQWCNRHLPVASCTLNEALPPLRYGTETFDLVYAFSVFTHLEEEMQSQWLEELARVLRPGGLLLCSVHGACVQERARLTADQQDILNSHGFLYIRNMDMQGILPEWYQMAFQTEPYVRRSFSRLFEVVAHLPRGFQGFQDLVILRKP